MKSLFLSFCLIFAMNLIAFAGDTSNSFCGPNGTCSAGCANGRGQCSINCTNKQCGTINTMKSIYRSRTVLRKRCGPIRHRRGKC